MKSKAAIIVTILNEEGTVGRLLDSLILQTKKPDEVIIIDAGSTDKTTAVLDIYRKKYSRLKIFTKKGNRSVGRNFAIKKSSSDIIAVTDAGCVPAKDWFQKITAPFLDKKIDVVAGYYKPKARGAFQKSLVTYTCVMPDKLTEDFLPSSRSIAFRKAAWKKVGGYPEHLDTCEDLVFARSLKKKGFRFFVAKNALVVWPQRKNLIEAFRQFFAYAKGDGEAGYIRFGTPILYLRFLIGFLILISPLSLYFKIQIFTVLFSLYFLWAILKNYRYVGGLKAFFYLPLLQITSDIAVFSGMTYGYIKRTVLK